MEPGSDASLCFDIGYGEVSEKNRRGTRKALITFFHLARRAGPCCRCCRLSMHL